MYFCGGGRRGLGGGRGYFFVLVLAGSWNFRGTVGSGFIPLFHLNMLQWDPATLWNGPEEGAIKYKKGTFSLENLEFFVKLGVP